jgi:hypothetical protein
MRKIKPHIAKGTFYFKAKICVWNETAMQKVVQIEFQDSSKNHITKYSNELENKMVVNSSRQNVLLLCCFYKLTPFLNDKKYFLWPTLWECALLTEHITHKPAADRARSCTPRIESFVCRQRENSFCEARNSQEPRASASGYREWMRVHAHIMHLHRRRGGAASARTTAAICLRTKSDDKQKW